jgi:hypothetical protein
MKNKINFFTIFNWIYNILLNNFKITIAYYIFKNFFSFISISNQSNDFNI